jgi:hypothetical protein
VNAVVRLFWAGSTTSFLRVAPLLVAVTQSYFSYRDDEEDDIIKEEDVLLAIASAPSRHNAITCVSIPQKININGGVLIHIFPMPYTLTIVTLLWMPCT